MQVITRIRKLLGMGNEDAETKDPNKEYREFLWQEPGFHRTLGSILFQYLPYLVTAFFSIVYFVIILPTFIPPETLGQNFMITYLMGFFFAMAEVGIGDAIQRFISEKRISQPEYTIYYIQFFIYFRLFSGLFLVTGISIWVISFLPANALLTYGMWFFLLYSMLEYPGFLTAYMSALQGYQQFNKVNYINVGMILVNVGTTYGLVNLFTFLGSLNPAIGGTMGSTFGIIISQITNNFIIFILSSQIFKQLIQKINPEWTLKKTFKIEFNSQILRECLLFGARSMVSTFLDTGMKMTITFLAISWLPDYATIYGIFTILLNLATLISIDIPITPIVSEAYNNKKFDLTEYYLGHGLKYCGLFASQFCSAILAIAPMFLVLTGPYALSVIYLPYIAINRVFYAFGIFLDNSCTACNHPFYRFYNYLFENGSRIILMYIFIIVFNYGWYGYLYAEMASYIIKNAGGWLLFHVKIMNPYMSIMQTIVLPLVAGIVNYLALSGLIMLLEAPLKFVFGAVIAIGIFVVIGFLITPLFVYWPVYTLLGGWDPVGLDILEEATEISDISKPIAKLFNRIVQNLARKSPFYNKFRIHFRSAQFQLDELRVMMGREPKSSLHVWDLVPQLIELDQEEIDRRTHELALKQLTHDECVHMLAEATLRVQDVIRRPVGQLSRVEGAMEINTDFLNDHPNPERIHAVAKEIDKQLHPSPSQHTVEDLYPLIAGRELLYDVLKRQKKKGKMETPMVQMKRK
ncbi:MAG TPA: lipopolysaccharide biosynthesis protein [Candidatus Lokiarchaeia archaeon]|nr:lipopolysaccharide biosynthesis protein [Candidatus Lokiarchaeia archaeon]